jgi:hypothetical protein
MRNLEGYIYLAEIMDWRNFSLENLEPIFIHQLESSLTILGTSSRTAGANKSDLKHLAGIAFPNEFKRTIAELADVGLSCHKISKHCKVNFITIKSWIPKVIRDQTFTEKFKGLVQDLYGEGMSPFTVAAHLKTQDYSIIKCLSF